MRTLTILLLCITCAAMTFAQTADEKSILQLEEQLRAAKLGNDVATLERLLDAEHEGYNQFGQNHNRASFLSLFAGFKQSKLLISDLKVKIVGNTAIVVGKQIEASTSNFSKEQHLQFSHVWIKRQNDWKWLFSHQQFDVKEGTVTPTGWNGSSNAFFLIGTDTAVKYSGNASGFVKAKHQENSAISTGLGQQIKADNYRGKRIRLNGWVKGEMNAGYAHCWMRVDAEDGEMLGFDNTLDEGNVLKPDWARFSIVLDVPEKSAVIFLGFQMVGRGQAWLDDWQLEVVEKDVPSTNQAPSEARLKQMQTMRTMNRAQWEQSIQEMKKRLPTLPLAPINLDFEAKDDIKP